MAKQSWKQQMYEQIANQQVQQVMQQQRAQQLQNDFANWQKQQNDIAQLQASFNEWKAAQPAQEAQPVQAAPVQAAQIPSIKSTQPKRNLQAEAREYFAKVKAERRKENEKAEFKNKLPNIGNKISEALLPEEVEALSAPKSREYAMPTAKPDNAVDYSARYSAAPQINEKARGGKEWNKAVTDTLNQLNSREQRAINKLTAAQNADRKIQEAQTQTNLQAVPEEVVKQYAEKKGVSVEAARAEIEDSIKKASAMNTSLQAPGGANEVTQQLTQEAQANSAEQKRLAAQRQYTPYETWGLATGKAVSDVVNGPVVLAGKLFGQDWDLYSDIDRERYAQSKEQHPTASNLGTMSGMALAGYAAGGGTGGRALASEGLPTAAEAFNATQGEALLNGAGKTEALLRGLGVAGRQMASNAAKDILKTDLATDIIPTLANDIVEGKSTGEVVGNTVLNTLLNGVFNSVGDIASLVKPVKNSLGGATTKAALNEALDSALEGNTRYAFDNVDDVVRNATLQADEAAQNIENIAKQMPEIPENVPNVAKNIPENVPKNVPVRPGTAAPVSPAIENEAEAMAKAMDAEEVAKAIEQPKPEVVEPKTPKLLSDDEESQLMYDFDRIDETYFANRAEIRQAIENMDFSIRNTAINDVPGKNGKMQYEIVDLDNNRKIKTFASRKAAEKAQAEYAAGNVLKEKAINALDDIRAALQKYQDAAFRSADVEEVNTAKKAVEAARKRYERAMKEYDPSYHDAIASKDFGDRIARPYYTRNPAAENPVDDALIDEMVNDWVQTDVNNPNRFVRDAEPETQNVFRGVEDNRVMAEDIGLNESGGISDYIDPETGNYVLEESIPNKGAYVKEGQSRVVTNSAINADIVTKEDLEKDAVIQDIANYARHNNDVTFAEAYDRVTLNGTQWKKDYISGAKAITDDTDVDTSMLLLQDLKNKMDTAKNPRTATMYANQRNALLSKLREYGTRSGQGIQAFAKWNNTADGAMLCAERMLETETMKPWVTNNQAAVTGNNRIAKALADMGHKQIPKDKPVLNHEQIKEGITAELKKEYGSIDNYFNDEDIEFLANLAEDKSIPLWQITDEIEHKLNHGTFYPIEKEVTEKFEGNSRLAGILKSMGDKTKPETKAPLTHDEIKKGITNELKREYADMEAQFTDSDIEFLTRLVEDKSVKDWQIADEISHKLAHGTWYSLDESLPEATIKNKQVSNILDNMYKDKKGAKPKKEMTIGELLTGIKNSFEADPISSAKNLTDDDYYFVAQMVQNNVPKWQIEDEILHRLEHGEWYTLDESIAQKPVKNRQVTQMLNNVLNGKKGKTEPKEMSYSELIDSIKNSFEDESISVAKDFTDSDYDFVAQMMQNNVPRWQIEDELAHKIQYGEWYTLDESTAVKKPTNSKIKSALNSLVAESVRTEEGPTLSQIADEVRNTLAEEFAEADETLRLFSDDDIDYLANLINNGTPQQEIADALNRKLATGKFGISLETQRRVNELFKEANLYNPNSIEFVERQAEAYRLLAEEVAPNATALEKYDTWRYLAMLGNPKTMLRNFVGNAVFNVVTGTSNSLAAVMEAGVDRGVKLGKQASNKLFKTGFDTSQGIQRTKSLLNMAPGSEDWNLIKASALDGETSRGRQMLGTKYEKMDTDFLRRQRSVFDSKLLRLYEKATDAGISDFAFVKAKFATSLAGYLKANGYDKSIFDAEIDLARLKNIQETRLLSNAERETLNRLSKDIGVLEKARDYALKQAEYATFHEKNVVADLLTQFSKNARNSNNAFAKAIGYSIEGTVPFKKTPANILRSGYEYSPLGALDSLIKTGKLIYENTGKRAGNLADVYINKKGQEVARTLAADVIESWSKTLTGSGMALMGYLLYKNGVLKMSDEDTKYQDQLEGIQNYSIQINGKTYTIDWAVPAFMPMALGAEIAKLQQSTGKTDEEVERSFSDYVGAADRLLEPMVETSMLSGVKDTLENASNAAQYSGVGSLLTSLPATALSGYASQAIPTLSGQIARTVDNTRRSTYSGQEDALLNSLERQGRKALNKIPFASMLNEPYINTYGERQSNSPYGNPVANLAYQMLSPSYINTVNTRPADTISRNAYDLNKNVNTLPTWKSYFKDSDGKRLSAKDHTKASAVYGKTNLEIRNALAEDEWFNGLTKAQQENIVKGINTLSENVALSAVDPNFTKDSETFNAYKEGGIPKLMDQYKQSVARSMANESGLSANSNASKEIQEAILEGKTEEAEQLIDIGTQITNAGIGAYGYEAYKANMNKIPNIEDWINDYKAIDSLGNSDGFVNQEEFIKAIKKNGWSEAEAVKYAGIYGTWKSKPYIKKDGTWDFK